MSNAEQKRAEARVDKGKLLEYLRKEKSFTNALMSERGVYASPLTKSNRVNLTLWIEKNN